MSIVNSVSFMPANADVFPAVASLRRYFSVERSDSRKYVCVRRLPYSPPLFFHELTCTPRTNLVWWFCDFMS